MPSLILSVLALVVSVTVAWLTLFRRGGLRMTRPVLVGFLYDQPAGDPKIFFRSLLFATGKRGHIVESIFLKVRHGKAVQTFSFWMYGETKALMIGSGLRVPEDGVAFNHHFLPPKNARAFEFLPGDYVIEIYARLVKRAGAILLFKLELALSEQEACELVADRNRGVLFTWDPDHQRYQSHIDIRGRAASVGE
jgi:hypothetical protein